MQIRVRSRRAMSLLISVLVAVSLLVPATASAQPGDEPAVLVFSATAGFRHQSIPAGIAAIEQLGIEHGFGVDTTEAAADFNAENLADYADDGSITVTVDAMVDGEPVSETWAVAYDELSC